MATTKLVIRPEKKNRDNECVVFVKVTHQSQNAYFSTGVKIPMEYWDRANCRVRKSFWGHTKLNQLLTNRLRKIEDVKLDLMLAGIEPTINEIRHRVKLSEELVKKSDILLDYWEDFIEEKSKKVKPITIKSFQPLHSRLSSYEEVISKRLRFDDFNDRFYEDFLDYLETVEELGPNTIGALIKNLKVFLGWTLQKGYSTGNQFRFWKKPRAATQVFALDLEEFHQLLSYDFNNPRLERVRDAFILSCCTGLRYSDLSRIKPHHVKSDYIVMISSKTNEELMIPLTEISRWILEKYSNKVDIPSNQKMNEYLKEAAREAGLDQPREIKSNAQGHRKEVRPLHEIISTHMGRKTFVTLSMNFGMSANEVRHISAHKDHKSFERYVAVFKDPLKEKMQEVWTLRRQSE